MRHEEGRVVGDQVIDEAVVLSGTIEGSVVVEASGSLRIDTTGVITGRVTVLAGGRLEVDGSVHGSVENEGGIIKHRGEIRGLLYGSGSTSIDTGASVNGRRI